MQAVINYPLIRSRARTGKIATAIGVLALAGGFLASLRMSAPGQEPDWAVVSGSYALLIISLGALSLGRYQISRWSRRPRADEALAEALKDFDSRYALMSYLPDLPVEHLLLTPYGLVVLVVRTLSGSIRSRGSRWSRKFNLSQLLGGYSEGGLGNPTAEARRGTAALRTRLNAVLGTAAADVPISAAIVFTDRLAKVAVEDPAVPVVKPDDLASHIRRAFPDRKLPRESIDQMLQVFAPDRSRFEPTSKDQPRPRRRRSRKPVQVVDQSKTGRNRAERRMH